MGDLRAERAVSSVRFRNPTLADGPAVHRLVDECKPLDLNSRYAYMLLCVHYADSCVVAERDGRVCGFVSAYRKPADASTLFVWQVAVSPAVRGQGVGGKMLESLLDRTSESAVRFLETTISPSNRASWALFESLAGRRGVEISRGVFFGSEDFGDESHEEESLLRIGPFRS